jgi:hypothetical protein
MYWYILQIKWDYKKKYDRMLSVSQEMNLLIFLVTAALSLQNTTRFEVATTDASG